MESHYVAIGFFRGERSYLYVDSLGRARATKNLNEASTFNSVEVAAVAALAMATHTKLAGCRAVRLEEAPNAVQV